VNAERHFRDQRTKDRARESFDNARWALNEFRHNGDASHFAHLRAYLYRKSSNRFENFDLSGYGLPDLGLTADEYTKMKMAYKATPVGAADSFAREQW
jgi:hypothetical protein